MSLRHYAYDALDLRVRVEADADGADAWYWTVHDGRNPYHAVTNAGVQNRYLQADAIDALLARTDGIGGWWPGFGCHVVRYLSRDPWLCRYIGHRLSPGGGGR